jgi:hypothetical protein
MLLLRQSQPLHTPSFLLLFFHFSIFVSRYGVVHSYKKPTVTELSTLGTGKGVFILILKGALLLYLLSCSSFRESCLSSSRWRKVCRGSAGETGGYKLIHTLSRTHARQGGWGPIMMSLSNH